MAAAKEAVSLSPQDRYYRTLTALDIASISSIAQSGKNDAATQQAFQSALSDAIQNASAAVSFDPTSYANWMSRASVYEAAVPFGIQGAEENALAALEEARKRNPGTPEVDYHEATLKDYAKDDTAAKTLAQASIAKKADYTPAILLLAQISLNQGNLNDAILSLKSAIVFTPGDSSLLYELGLLELQAKSYDVAAEAFTNAIAITPNYQNAMFYLGEADVFLGKTDAALALFKDLAEKNPDNTVLTDVISKVEAGKNPFIGTQTLPPETAGA
jgi:tetratricopeptide (TPR) repeat protein